MDFSEMIRRALTLPDFDVDAARYEMAIAGRKPKRPSHLTGEARVGAVLCLLYPVDGELMVVLTKRPESLRDHSGQISFPGGRQDEGESLEETALREADEEVGNSAEFTTLLGTLTTIYIPPTDFIVHPFVGWAESRPQFVLNPAEVAELLEVPLSHLLDPQTRNLHQRPVTLSNGTRITVPYYDFNGHQIWGATAIMLSEFIGRWRAAQTMTEH